MYYDYLIKDAKNYYYYYYYYLVKTRFLRRSAELVPPKNIWQRLHDGYITLLGHRRADPQLF
jgi:hypothetical protein